MDPTDLHMETVDPRAILWMSATKLASFTRAAPKLSEMPAGLDLPKGTLTFDGVCGAACFDIAAHASKLGLADGILQLCWHAMGATSPRRARIVNHGTCFRFQACWMR